MLPVNEIYGPNRPFTSKDGADVVMFGAGNVFPGNRVSGFLLFHKVQPPNTHPSVTTGFGAFGSTSTGAFFQDFNDANYNVNGVDPSAIRVYGCTGFYITFDFAIGQPVSMFLAMDTIDGVRANL